MATEYLNVWRDGRIEKLSPLLESMTIGELAEESYYEVMRDFICPFYEAIPQLLATKLEQRETNELKSLRHDYVWENDETGVHNTIFCLKNNKRSKEEHEYLMHVLPRLQGGIILLSGNNQDLLKAHDESTMACSFAHMMRRHSTTYPLIMEKGMEIVPGILEYLETKGGGMSIILLLMDITKENPYKPDTTTWKGMAGYNVCDTAEAWLDWGREKGIYPKKKESACNP